MSPLPAASAVAVAVVGAVVTGAAAAPSQALPAVAGAAPAPLVALAAGAAAALAGHLALRPDRRAPTPAPEWAPTPSTGPAPAWPGPRERRRPGLGSRAALPWRTAPVDHLADVARTAVELSSLLGAGVGTAAAWAHAAGAPAARGEPVGAAATRAAVGPDVVGAAVRAAAEAAATGGDVAGALRAAAAPSARARGPLESLAAAWHVTERTGAPAAAVLERLGEALLAERDHALARAAAMAGPRSSAAVLTALPVAGLLLGVLLGVDPVGVLVGTAAGRACAVVGVAAALGGRWWVRVLVRRAEDAP